MKEYKEYEIVVESTNRQIFLFHAKSEEEAEELLWQELSEQCVGDADCPISNSWLENAKIRKIIELVSLNEDEAKLTGKQYNENN